MPNRYPLIVNPSANQIQEIPAADTLDLTGNDLIVTGITSLATVRTGNINSSGIITASGGFNIGISSGGTPVTTGPVTTLNFLGVGNTFSVNGTTINISTPGVATTTRSGLIPATSYSSISYGSTVNLDLSVLDGQARFIVSAGNLELTTSNLAIGRTLKLRIVGFAGTTNFTFPVDWKFQGTKPTSLPPNKVARLAIECWGTTNADVDAVCTVQS